MKALMFAALLAATPLGSQALAGETAAAVTDQAERQRLAVQLLDASGYEKQVVDSAVLSGLSIFEAGLKNAMGADAYAAFPTDLHDDLRKTMATELQSIAAKVGPESKEKAAAVYARYFTSDDLRRLIVLYDDPVFRRLQSVAPQLVTELMTMGMEAFQPYSAAFEARIQEVIKRWQDNNKEARSL